MAEGQAVVDSNPSTETAPVTGQAESVNPGTVETNISETGQAKAPAEETFSNIDPKTLPPELQAVYKNLQADYTKKTQEVADARKKAKAYDQISGDKRFVDYWNGLNKQQKADFQEQKQEAEKRLGEKISDDDFAKAFNSKDDFLSLLERVADEKNSKSKKEIEQLKEQLFVKDAQDVVESFATEVDKSTGQLKRPDFYTLDEDQLITGFLSVNPPEDKSQQASVARLNEAYSWAKAVSQKYYEKGRADAHAVIQRKAATSSEPPTNAAKGAYTGPDPKKLSVREAIDLAKKGQRVPRDD